MMNPIMNDQDWQERTDAWVQAQDEQRMKKEKQREMWEKLRKQEIT
jgi:urease accessory protein UreF